MKRVVVTTSFPSFAGDPTGTFVLSEARQAVEKGDDVHVLAPAAWRDDARLLGGVQLHPMGGGQAFGWPGFAQKLRARPWRSAAAAQFVLAAHRHLKRMRPDVVEAHWLLPSAWPIGLTADAPLDVVCHGGDIRLLCRLPAPLRCAVLQRVLDHPGHIRFVAQALRDVLTPTLPAALAARLLDSSSVRPCALGALTPSVSQEQLCARLGIGPFAAVVGRLLASKRVELAINAATELAIPLVVVGDGPDETALRALGGGTVKFVGRLTRSDTIDIIAAARVLLHPSDVDAAPTVVLEARALGTPVASRGAGDVGLWADTDPGIAVDQTLARAIEKVLCLPIANRHKQATRSAK